MRGPLELVRIQFFERMFGYPGGYFRPRCDGSAIGVTITGESPRPVMHSFYARPQPISAAMVVIDDADRVANEPNANTDLRDGRQCPLCVSSTRRSVHPVRER